jgi:hypothetical protein
MYLTAYHFDGNPAELIQGHDRLLAANPAVDMDLHFVAVGEAGITVLDACPSRSVFEEFSTSAGFRAALADAGLPSPRIQPLGDISGTVKVSTEAVR